ncbi:hypothetical protein [Desulfocurvus vexinensis]|uniref:hypothetical protein n=1 Tax=Desulfocurvus vexinensis TaxID=399548 RepID=UPI0004B35790|nr:hypothetical protein [Desulfocurvus vexinensis]
MTTSVTTNALLARIKEFYPELGRHGVELSARLDEASGAWIVTMTTGAAGEHSLSTHVEAQDAEKCMQGVECLYLGVQVGRFIENHCLGGGACPK